MPIIAETQRLILRRFRDSDLQDLHEYLSDADTLRFEPYLPMDMDEAREELTRRIAAEDMIAVEMKSTGKLIGNIYLSPREFSAWELGYVFNRRFWGQGCAKEACRALIKKTFASGAHRIYAECDPLNPASWRLLESLGFAREAHFRKNVYFRTDENGAPIWKDTFVYALLNESI